MPNSLQDTRSDPAVSAAFERLKLELSPALDDLETQRRALKANVVRGILLGVAAGLVLLALTAWALRGPLQAWDDPASPFFELTRMAAPMLMIAVAGYAISALNPAPRLARHRAEFKQRIVQEVGAGFSYREGGEAGRRDYNASHLFAKPDKFATQDAFAG